MDWDSCSCALDPDDLALPIDAARGGDGEPPEADLMVPRGAQADRPAGIMPATAGILPRHHRTLHPIPPSIRPHTRFSTDDAVADALIPSIRVGDTGRHMDCRIQGPEDVTAHPDGDDEDRKERPLDQLP